MGHRPLIGKNYLKARGGKNRSGRAWYVRVMVPKELRGIFGRNAIEEALHTTDFEKAKRLRNLKVVEIFESFDRALLGRMTSADIQLEAERYWRKRFSELQEKPGDLLQVAIHQSEEHEVLEAEMAVPPLIESIAEENWLPDIQKEATRIANGYGTALDSGQHRELCLALTYAEIDVMERLVIIHHGGVPPAKPVLNTKAFDVLTGEPLQPTRLSPQKGVAMRIRQAASKYLDTSYTGRSHGWTEQTRRQATVTLNFFADFTQDATLDAVTRQNVIAFIDALSTLDPKYGKRKGDKHKDKKLDFDAVLKKYPVAPGKGLSIKTLKRHCGAIAGLFEWAKDEGQVAGDNPAKGHHFSKRKGSGSTKEERKPFSNQELRWLITGPKVSAPYEQRVRPENHSVETALRWLIPIALYTGMRLDEICGLRVMDVREDGNIEFFNITSYEGHRLKTPASERQVPIHAALIEIGFGDYFFHVQEAGHEFLFPALKCGGPDKKRSWYIGKRFTAYRRDLKIPDTKVFHSFRKNVATILEQERVPENEAAQLLGHKKPKITYGLYSGGLSLKELKRVVDAIKYPNLDLRHLHKPKAQTKAIPAKQEATEAAPLR
jgi:integrase